jgi:DNA-directed RNA polymerase specialized sigma24 family protein
LNGSASAEFTEFAHGRWPSLVRFGYGLTGDRGVAEDLAQATLVNAYASWPRVRKADDPDAYVRRILLNAFRGGFRKRRVAEELSDSPPDSPVADPVRLGLGTQEHRQVVPRPRRNYVTPSLSLRIGPADLGNRNRATSLTRNLAGLSDVAGLERVLHGALA